MNKFHGIFFEDFLFSDSKILILMGKKYFVKLEVFFEKQNTLLSMSPTIPVSAEEATLKSVRELFFEMGFFTKVPSEFCLDNCADVSLEPY